MATPLSPARVSFAAREEYRLILPERVGGSPSPCELPAEPSGKLRAFDELPCVGDWVDARILGDFAYIEAVHPRRTAFVRKAAGKASAAQCVAANIDVVFLICGLDGDFNPRRLERYLLLAHESGARPVVVLNKADLAGDQLDECRQQAAAVAPGLDVLTMSAVRGDDALRLRDFLKPGDTAALLGSSGAGKSTIANALGGSSISTQPVRESDSRGRHTTTARMLIPLPGDAWLIDTPGMRELGLWATGDDALGGVFPEILALAAACRFTDCRHASEPGCAVQAALLEGGIAADRWASFQKLQAEIRHHEVKTSVEAAQAQKRLWKNIHKAQRQHYKIKNR